MADIVTPMTTAMKTRAKAAAEYYRPAGDTSWVANFTPREYRAMVRNGSNDAELAAEGWLEDTVGGADFRSESNIPVRLP